MYSANLFNNMRCWQQIDNHRVFYSKYVVMFHIYIGILIILPIVDHKISQFELKNSGHL